MTHDPLCPFSRECIGGEHEPFAVGPLTCSNTECLAICDCDLIAKVRADERSMCAGAGQNHNENVMELTEDA